MVPERCLGTSSGENLRGMPHRSMSSSDHERVRGLCKLSGAGVAPHHARHAGEKIVKIVANHQEAVRQFEQCPALFDVRGEMVNRVDWHELDASLFKDKFEPTLATFSYVVAVRSSR